MNKIQEIFAKSFSNWGLELPDPVPAKGSLSGKGWFIDYVLLKDDNNQPCLEYVASNRMTNSRHVRILSSGEVVSLPGFDEDYSYNPDIPGDEEASRKRRDAHNAAVTADLQAKGLME